MRSAVLTGFLLAVCSACSDGGGPPAVLGGGNGGGSGTAGTSGAGGTAGAGLDATAGSGGTATGGTGGAAGSAGTGAGGTAPTDAGSDADAALPSWTGAATRTTDGVLTNLPGAGFAASGTLVITTAYFRLIEISPTFTTIDVWGDFENRGAAAVCLILGDLSIAGVELVFTTSAPAYARSSSLTSDCVEPGGTGAYHGIENEVPPTLLDEPFTVAYSISGIDPGETIARHPDDPALLAPRIGPVERGWGVSGLLQTTANPIYNFSADLYARDVSGLLFDDDFLYPGDLDTLPVSAQLRFTSKPIEKGVASYIDGPFAGFEYFASFIEGVKPAARNGEAAPSLERRTLAADRRAAVLGLRAARDAQRNSISSK